jgi:hypothetical protein
MTKIQNPETKIIWKHESLEFVIPGLTRNPVFSWIPAVAGMTTFGAINAAMYNGLFWSFRNWNS